MITDDDYDYDYANGYDDDADHDGDDDDGDDDDADDNGDSDDSKDDDVRADLFPTFCGGAHSRAASLTNCCCHALLLY